MTPPDRPSAAAIAQAWLSDLRDHMEHCVLAADEGEDYAVSRPMLDAMTTLGLMTKVGRGKWAPTDEGRQFAERQRSPTLPIDIRGEWYEVPIPVHLHVIALRDAARPAEAGEVDDATVQAALAAFYNGDAFPKAAMRRALAAALQALAAAKGGECRTCNGIGTVGDSASGYTEIACPSCVPAAPAGATDHLGRPLTYWGGKAAAPAAPTINREEIDRKVIDAAAPAVGDKDALHKMNGALCTFGMRWKLDGDYLRCRTCKRPIIASHAGPFVHDPNCTERDSGDPHPWQTFVRLLQPIATPRGPGGREADPILRGLPEAIARLDPNEGRWQPCSGCYETEDGHPVGDYPHSPILGCVLGGGCHECGGLGAVWDTLNYNDFAEEALQAASGGEVGNG